MVGVKNWRSFLHTFGGLDTLQIEKRKLQWCACILTTSFSETSASTVEEMDTLLVIAKRGLNFIHLTQFFLE